MRRFTLVLLSLIMGLGLAFSQTKVSGLIVASDNDEPIFGANILVKGTTNTGTTSDLDGKFTLNVPAGSKTLVVSYIGYQTMEVAVSSNLVIKMEPSASSLDEVVVTAMGISRQKKALGYAVADVKGDEMLKSRGGVSNPINSLTGKVAGLQITGGSGNMGGSSKILIRGVNSLSGNNQPLFVIDGVPIEGTDFNSTTTARGAGGYDYGNLIQDINPDDIESMSILKGPNASALYGSRASNGVIMITTKKGTKNAGLGISFNTSVGFERVNKLPKMQNLYGGGYSLTEQTIDGKTVYIMDYDTDESWGPRYDGSDYVSWYDLAKWENAGKPAGGLTTSKWQAPKNDINKFFETGVSFTNNISIAQATDKVAFRVSYTNTTLKGYMPNSSMQKNAFNASGSVTPNKYIELFSNFSYLNQAAKGRSETGYGDNNVMQKFIQWGQRQLDMKELKDLYKYNNGMQAGWNRVSWDDPQLAYSNNPYWSRYMNYQNDTRDRVYGNIGTRITIADYLKAQYKLNVDFFNDKQYERRAVYSQEQSYYGETQRQQLEYNHEFMLMSNNRFGLYTLDANIGANMMRRDYSRLLGESVGGLSIPEFYNLSNSNYTSKSENLANKKGINSLFGNITAGYKSMVYLDLSLRNDWSSTLPKGNNSYLYPSVTGSFIFSELIKDKTVLSFGKLRLGWAQVGNDTDPYRVLNTYSIYDGSYDGNLPFLVSSTLNNPNLRPERTTSYEMGLELFFLKNRISTELTLYSGSTKDQIIPLAISGATGYRYKMINAGEITNKGIELALGFKIFQSRNFDWTMNITGSTNKNKVVELLPESKYYRLAPAPFVVEVGAYAGKEYGQIMGTDYIYKDGQKVVDSETGEYMQTAGNVPLGKVFPDLIYGITNTFRYKNFDFSFLIDGQSGAKFFSTSRMWGMYSGMLEETAANGIRENGIIIPGVFEDGTPNNITIDAETWGASQYTGPAAQNVLSSNFVKLREVTIGYTVPLKSNKVFKDLKISAYGRNLLTFGPDTKHFDPETATTNSGNVQGIEGGALPGVATFGVNLSVKF